MCGCTPEEAEHILDTFIALGDKYCGENEVWVGFKKDVQENTKFWAVAISCGVAGLAIMTFALILIGKTNPAVRRAMFGMSESLKVSDRMSKATSQTLAKMESRFNEAMEMLQEYKEVIKGQEDQIISLSRHIETLKTAIKKERSNLLYAAMNNLRMIKLVIDRTTMPMSDKATVDHWYAKGIDSIKDELNASDIQKIDSMSAMLDSIGDGNGEG
jgi:TolA-binding protein